MTSMEEFAFIAAQLAWLEEHLRSEGPAPEGSRMHSALNALVCAQAVIVELTQLGGRAAIGRGEDAPAT
ncbi:MAG TPA: hypothetical protein VE029_07700 [Rhizobacter sp.]|nr:hypothetical protein [Rhizobacter sp.]